VRAWEVDPAEAAKAASRVKQKETLTAEVNCGDFLKFFLWEGTQCPRFDGAVGNPPFIRYQYLPEVQQAMAEKIFARFGLPFTKHTNAWVPFVIASLALLAPGGRLAMVLPSEILHIRHALGLRRYLAAQCARVLIIDPEELCFEGTLQGVVLLLAEKKSAVDQVAGGVAVESTAGSAAFQSPARQYFESAVWVYEDLDEGKWMPLLLSGKERALLSSLADSQHVSRFGDVAEVDVGIVTGANQFFLVPDETVSQYELGRWAHPMFGRSEHVNGVIYEKSDHEANRAVGLPTNFLWFDPVELAEFPEPVQRYLRRGAEEGLAKRYKCRVREPWYRVPSVYAAPVAMLKRCHHFPRLVLNRAGAFTTDTAYRIRTQPGTDTAALVYSFVNSLTCLSAELEGRHYGGGVLELVPSEIERLLLPRAQASGNQLAELDRRIRSGATAETILASQDAALFGEGTCLNRHDQAVLRGAWDKLRRRRQRITSAGTEDAKENSE
jgi:adenine-specific DNA methylase